VSTSWSSLEPPALAETCAFSSREDQHAISGISGHRRGPAPTPSGNFATMWIAVVAGSFGIGGVVLGVLLEPVKAIFARRVRARDERAERCARLIEAAVSARMYALGINRVHRFRSAGREVDKEWAASNQRAYNEARREIHRAAALISMSGPGSFAERSVAVRQAEGTVFLALHTADDEFEPNQNRPSAKMRGAGAALDQAVDAFAESARHG